MLHTHRQGPARAFTLAELLIVLFLSAVFGLIITQVVNGATSTSQHLLNQTLARTDAHTALADLQRALRGARPLGACLDSGQPADKPLSACQRVGEYPRHPTSPADPRPLEVATATHLVLYTNDAGSAQRCPMPAAAGADPADPGSPADALRPPERVEITVTTDDQLVIRRWCAPSGTTYTTALTGYRNLPMTAAPNVVIDGGIVTDPTGALPGDPALFTFYDANGTQLTQFTTDGALAHPEQVAMVEVQPRFTAGHGQSAADFTADVFVPLAVSDPNEGDGQ